MNEPLLVRREVQIAEPPANVFAFLADPEKILIWMGPRQRPRRTPAGSISSKASATQLAWRTGIPRGRAVHRLAYSFGWDGDDEMPP